MEIEVNREFTVTLKLSSHEARWLKDLVQNPLSEDESKDTAQMRNVFWNALDHVQEMRNDLRLL